MQPGHYVTPYQPSRLLDAIRQLRGLRNDTELAAYLEVGGSLISKVRSGCLPLSGGLLLRIHEVTAVGIRDMKTIVGDRRQKQRFSPNKSFLQETGNTVYELTAKQGSVRPRKRA